METAAGDVVLGESTIGVLNSNQVADLAFDVVVPDGLELGRVYPIRVEVDPDQLIAELNEENNQYLGQAESGATPDRFESELLQQGAAAVDLGRVQGELTVDALSLDNRFDRDFFIINLGAEGAAGNQIEVLFSQTDGDVNVFLHDAAGRIVREGRSADDNEVLDLQGVPAGAYVLFITRGSESSNGNPNYSIRITAPESAGPNLVVDALALESAIVVNQINVTGAIANIGNLPAAASVARFFLSTDLFFDEESDLAIGPAFSVDAIQAGAVAAINQSLPLVPGTVVPGQYYLILRVDTNGQISESGESDNGAAKVVTILGTPEAIEPNDDVAKAATVEIEDGRYEQSGFTLPPGDLDFYRFHLPSIGAVTSLARLTFDTNEGDLKFSLVNRSGTILSVGRNEPNGSLISLAGRSADDYLLVVQGNSPGAVSTGYTLKIVVLPSFSVNPSAGPVAPGSVGPVPSAGTSDSTAPAKSTSTQDPVHLGLTSERVATTNPGEQDVIGPFQNGSFAVTDPGDPGFAWTLRGGGVLVNGHAELNEGAPHAARITQTFVIPDDATLLRFTLTRVELAANPLNPPDAFEVALQSQATPAAGVAADLAGTDALLNIQADGRVYLAPTVAVPGINQSGDDRSFNAPTIVEVDLRDLPDGSIVTLTFDLVSFGGDNSQVIVDDVHILQGPAPPRLAFQLDPESDSGSPGDDRTNAPVVKLVGTTDANLEVRLDLDGDGFNDGTVTADEDGLFAFDGIPLNEGANNVRIEVSNPEGTTVSERGIVLDRTAPRVEGVVINAGAAQRSALTTVAIRFSEAVTSGSLTAALRLMNQSAGGLIDSESVAASFDSATNTVIWSFPGQAGESLPDGNFLATLSAAETTDVAGNALESELSFEFFRYYGDLDGDRDVDFLDLYGWRRTWLHVEGEAEYDRNLDHDFDGDVDAADLVRYQDHYLTVFPAEAVVPQSEPNLSRGALIKTALLMVSEPVLIAPRSSATEQGRAGSMLDSARSELSKPSVAGSTSARSGVGYLISTTPPRQPWWRIVPTRSDFSAVVVGDVFDHVLEPMERFKLGSRW